MSAGEFVMRHLWCCIANDVPAGSCTSGRRVVVSRGQVVRALWSLSASLRHDVYTYARMGPTPKHPYTGLCILARRRGVTPSQLRHLANLAADRLTAAL
jgi:hypothetical protein